jgi:hypothetical protein
MVANPVPVVVGMLQYHRPPTGRLTSLFGMGRRYGIFLELLCKHFRNLAGTLESTFQIQPFKQKINF